jgi:hypothetical protein
MRDLFVCTKCEIHRICMGAQLEVPLVGCGIYHERVGALEAGTPSSRDMASEIGKRRPNQLAQKVTWNAPWPRAVAAAFMSYSRQSNRILSMCPA